MKINGEPSAGTSKERAVGTAKEAAVETDKGAVGKLGDFGGRRRGAGECLGE